MNRILLSAAVLSLFTAIVHTFIGTPEIEEPLINSSLPLEVSLLLYACWHIVTVTLAMSAVAFFIAARIEPTEHTQYLAKLMAYMWILFGLVFIVIALGYSDTSMLLKLPQWSLLLPVGALGLWGCSKPDATKAVTLNS